MKCILLFCSLLSVLSWNVSASDIFQDNHTDGGVCPECPLMTSVRPGHFLMGATPNVGHDDEKARGGGAFAVSINKGFSVSIGTITRAQFRAFLKENPTYKLASGCAGVFDGTFAKRSDASWTKPGFRQDDRHPVVCVRWQDAAAYVEWLSAKTGMPYRLLTEAEWEYVARAGSRKRYWWGESFPERMANCLIDCQDDFDHTAPVHSFTPNPFGLYHILGNVWEWTQDCYFADAYRRFEGLYPAPVIATPDCHRVIRGGSWVENAWSLRSSNREGWRADIPLNDLGFRVARDGVEQAL